MVSGISFFTPIISGDHPSTRFPLVEFFDNYFDSSEKKLKVIKAIDPARFMVCEVDYTANKITNFFKRVTYLTGIIPLIMIIGKIIARAQYHFTEIPKQNIVTIQSAMRGKLARNAFREMKAAVTVQAAVRGANARREFQALKAAAVTLQSHYRGYKARRKFCDLRNAALTMQSAIRNSKEQRSFQALKTAVVTCQSRFRSLKARGAYKALKGDHKTLRNLLRELVNTEVTNFETVSKKLTQLVELDSKTYLKVPKHEEQLTGALKTFKSHLERNASILNGMKTRVPGFCNEQKSDLQTISLMELDECVKQIAIFILSDEFEEFLNSQIEITRQKRSFDEITDSTKIQQQVTQWGNFNPYTLAGFQRLTRYQLLGKDILKRAHTVCTPEVVQLIERAQTRLMKSVDKCNTAMRIDDINTFIRDHGNVQGTVGSYKFYHLGSWLGNRDEAQAELEKIEREIEFTATKILTSPPKTMDDLESDDAKVQNLNFRVVSLKIQKDMERAKKVLSNGAGKVTTLQAGEVCELKELKETLLKALSWIKGEEKKELIAMIKRIIAEEILFIGPQNEAGKDEIARLIQLSQSL